MQMVLSSNNAKKIKELQEILAGFEVRSYRDFLEEIEVVEDGKSFEENARLKAEAIFVRLNQAFQGDFIVLADDSGLCVEALEGMPGVYSARFANLKCNLEELLQRRFDCDVKGASDEANNLRLIASLEALGIRESEAYFECVIGLCGRVKDQKIEKTFEGRLYGKVGVYPLDTEAFGYDPLFVPEGYALPLHRIQEKNQISHRFRALQKLKDFLKELS